MFKEIKDYFSTVDQLKFFHQEIEYNTINAYKRFLESLIALGNLWTNYADEDYKSKYPVFATKSIVKANPNDFQSTVVKNLINEKPSDETLRYKYVYIDRHNNEDAVIVDLELLKELFEKDDIKVTINYDEYQKNFDYYYDTISISMYCKDLERLQKEKESSK